MKRKEFKRNHEAIVVGLKESCLSCYRWTGIGNKSYKCATQHCPAIIRDKKGSKRVHRVEQLFISK